MKAFVTISRGILWSFFALQLCVTLVLLSGGSFPVMGMVACVVLFASLALNYSLFDRNGERREEADRGDRPELGIPVDVDRTAGTHIDMEPFERKLRGDSGITGGSGLYDVQPPQALGDGPAEEDEEPPSRKAVD